MLANGSNCSNGFNGLLCCDNAILCLKIYDPIIDLNNLCLFKSIRKRQYLPLSDLEFFRDSTKQIFNWIAELKVASGGVKSYDKCIAVYGRIVEGRKSVFYKMIDHADMMTRDNY